jgi:hypothetical protein
LLYEEPGEIDPESQYGDDALSVEVWTRLPVLTHLTVVPVVMFNTLGPKPYSKIVTWTV